MVHGESILKILTEATQVQEKENGAKRGKQRAGSVPRAKTPANAPSASTSSNKTSTAAPARPPSGMSTRTRSASAARRPRLGEATSTNANQHPSVNSTVAPLPVPIVPLTSSRTRPPSPSGVRAPTTVNSKAQPTPQPAQSATKRATPMGRIGSAQRNRAHNYHPYARTQRSVTAPQVPAVRVYGAVSYGAVGLNSSMAAAPAASTARKVSAPRLRRESFKPRPSMDNEWAGGGGDKRFAGFAGGVVQEEDEDF